MESEELKRRFAPKVLNKRISGQRLLPTQDFKSFKYGDFEEVWVTPFQFVYYFGGFPGAPFQQPGEAFAWIKSIRGPQPYFWEVRKKDLDGNYSELEENR